MKASGFKLFKKQSETSGFAWDMKSQEKYYFHPNNNKTVDNLKAKNKKHFWNPSESCKELRNQVKYLARNLSNENCLQGDKLKVFVHI